MTSQRIRYGVLGLAAALIFLFLFVQSQRVNEADNSRYRGELSQLESLHATLNETVLQVRLGILTYFDPLNNTLNDLDAVRQQLGQFPAFIDSQEQQDIKDSLTVYDGLIAQKRDIIEHFKTQNAVLVNSLSYFTSIVPDVNRQSSGSTAATSIVNPLNRLLQNILLYNITVDPNLVPSIQVQVAFLKTHQDQFVAEIDPTDINLNSLITQAALVLANKPATNDLVNQMAALPIPAQLTTLTNLYDTDYQAARQSVVIYQVALYLFSLAVIAFISVTIISRLRRSATVLQSAQNELQVTYGNLEKRTQELESTNADLETATREAREASRLKDEFLAVMSHELRTPLNAIIGFQGILLMGGKLEERATHMIQRSQANAERLLALINDILDISRIESGRLQLAPVDLPVRETVEKWRSQMSVLADQKGVKFSIDLDDSLPATIYADEDAMTKVVTNLLGNAFKFTEEGEVSLRMKRVNDNCVIEVSDSGIGIPAHMHQIIFERFRQVDGSSKRKYGGSGLGLAIVHNLCKAMDGTITVQSTPGKGSTFTVTLPLTIASEERQYA